MRTSVTWINDYLDRPASAEEQAELLTAAGLNFDGGDVAENGEPWQEIETTSNRGDCLCHVGMAREVCAMSGRSLKAPDARPKAAGGPAAAHVAVTNDDHAACPRYTARVIRGVKVGPSPEWLQKRLRAIGQIPRNNLVDCTNFVLFELGQPTHVFDLRKLKGGEIRVRRASAGEPFLPLGEHAQPIKLTAQDLVIADAERPVALAGVKGGAETAVDESTVDVLLEAATFSPTMVRHSSRRHQIFSDSGKRFERGVHPASIDAAADRLAALILETAGGELATGTLEAGAPMPPPRTVRMRPSRCQALLGIPLAEADMTKALAALGFAPAKKGDALECTVPAQRMDIEREVDLIEEVARLNGYESIPETLPRGMLRLGAAPSGPSLSRARDTLVALGYFEAVTFSFIPERAHAAFSPDVAPVLLANPIASDMSAMRPSLVPGLLAAVRFNRNRQQQDVRLFEYGMTFSRQGNELIQRYCLAGVVSGRVHPPQWAAASHEVDYFDVKQDLETLLSALGFGQLRHEEAAHPAYHPRQFARVTHDGRCIATIGAVHPKVLRVMDLGAPALAFEIQWEALGAAPPPAFQPLSRFPSVRRDLALVVAESVAAEAVLRCVRNSCGEALRDLQLFDVYRGQGIDSGKKSLALGLIFQSASSTLTDTEIEEMVAGVVMAVGRDLDGVLRT